MELVRQWKVLAVGLQVFVLLLTDAVEGTFEKEGYQLFKDGSLQGGFNVSNLELFT